tara:strand:- start:8510 stop:9850 length:1341 start_codon:yes stop_codon:yes gene_type:complete
MLNKIFKAYDVRGTYPEQLNEKIAYNIGKAFATFLGCKEVIVGYDMRLSSPSLVKNFSQGVVDVGCNIIDIGEVCTDASYFASGFLKNPSVMFTASHNPPEYNGLKFTKAGALPINEDTGLKDMKEIIESGKFKEAKTKGKIIKKEILKDYVNHVKTFADVNSIKGLKIAVDAGNGMAGKIIPLIYEGIDVEIVPMFFELDGSFPNHLADPSKFENLKDIQKKIKKEKCDFGMAFDGDADRIFFVDENGGVIISSLLSCVIIKKLLSVKPKQNIIYNVVVGRIVPETVKELGGKPILERVGHSFIKDTMRKTNSVFACEHSAHYYYRDNYNADSGMITSLIVSEIIAKSGKKISELIEEFKKYYSIEETNVSVEDKPAKMDEIEKLMKEQGAKKISRLDGVSVEFDDWWFNVRPSNTEPLLRLNLESKSEKLMKEKKKEIVDIMKN